MESIESQKIEVGDIFFTTEKAGENKPLIMVANIICDGEPGRKVVNSSWGTRHYNSDGCSLNYKVSLDNGETWNYEDGEGHYVDTGWIGELIKMGHWSLLQKNINFFDGLNESEEDFDWLPNQSEIGLKVKVNNKTFFIKNPIHQQDNGMFTQIIYGWNDCYEIIGEEILKGVDCYVIKLTEDYPEVYLRKKDFLEKDFCGIDDTSKLFESEKNKENYDCVGINLSNLTTDEKIKILEKLEQVYNTFVGFSKYAWVDQIQYLVTDFTTPVTMPLKGKRNQCGRWLNYVPENAYKEETDSYEIPVSMDGTKVKWSREIDAREILNIPFIDDISNLFESEENYEWLEDLSSEPFQNVLIKNQQLLQLKNTKLNPRIPHLSDDIDIIMFNPPVAVGDKRFNKIAYWLEDEDYYPSTLEEFGLKTSYIEITRHKDDRQNGRWKIGPELNEQELYNLSQTPKHPDWNGNFWEEELHSQI